MVRVRVTVRVRVSLAPGVMFSPIAPGPFLTLTRTLSLPLTLILTLHPDQVNAIAPGPFRSRMMRGTLKVTPPLPLPLPCPYP